MTLLVPAALALSALAIPIIAMYILKLRRREQVVSSTLLWQRVLDDLQANAPWQKLRPGILLVLQLLALFALVLALAGPAYTSSRQIAGDVIVIVDESYGMQAHDVAPSRFAVAIARAHALIGQLPDGNVGSIIGMGAQPHLAIAESADTGALNRAVDGLKPEVGAPNVLAALSLAASLARQGHATRAVVITSRESGIVTLPLHTSFPVELVRIGSSNLHDLGVTDISALRAGNAVEALVRIGNFGGSTERSDLDLCVNGQIADVRPISVGAGKQDTELWNDLPASTRVVQVRLAHRDDVTLDKDAWAVIPTPVQRRVLLVGHNDPFTQTALSLDPTVQLTSVTPSRYVPALASHYDLVVFDGTLPASLPGGSTLILSPPSGRVQTESGSLQLGRFAFGGSVTASSSQSSASSILQYADLSDVHVERFRLATLPAWMLPVVASTTGPPLIAAGESQGRRVVVSTFNLQESDWPLRISFPIVMQNVLHYLAPGFGVGVTQVRAGQPVPLFAPPGTQSIRVSRPGGQVDTLKPPFAPFTDTGVPGIYTAHAQGGVHTGSIQFAANFLPSRPAPAVGPGTVLLGATSSGHTARATRGASAPVNVGWAVAIVVLGLLSVEWWVAFRR